MPPAERQGDYDRPTENRITNFLRYPGTWATVLMGVRGRYWGYVGGEVQPDDLRADAEEVASWRSYRMPGARTVLRHARAHGEGTYWLLLVPVNVGDQQELIVPPSRVFQFGVHVSPNYDEWDWKTGAVRP